MRAVIQRVSSASVLSNGVHTGSIGNGFLILLGIETTDGQTDAEWIADKIWQMRIFQDKEDKMNLSLKEVDGEILLISQFTLYASTKKGNRPSFLKSARLEQAIPLYEHFKSFLAMRTGLTIQTGIFGADMKVSLVNDGPVTIILDSKNKE
ncbi:MAG: D-tyrosyl-tRNA(Tyr) deacylase [Saprospiraceae bacterium]|nr:D-tyrosyl-tRNA(Tyr) deacylase [Candidatus Opimibacter iunctus]